MRTENAWRRRGRGYRYLFMGVGLLGVFLIIAGMWPGDWAWVFAVAGFGSFVILAGKGLALWNLDGAVFEPRRSRRIDRSSVLERGAMFEPNSTAGRRASRVLTWQSKDSLSPSRDGGR